MWDAQQPSELPSDFAGRVRLFPLPSLVMFPHVVQPLHIFEPRYRAMFEGTLATDQLLAMALLQPGWEQDYEGRPPIHPVVCVGKVIAHTRLDDGKFNLLLLGLRRASLVRELPPEKPYREAEVAILEDLYPQQGMYQRSGVRRELLRCFRRYIPESPAAQEQFEALMNNQLPLGVLVDIVAFTLKFSLEVKQRLLSEWNVDVRAYMLMEEMRSLTHTAEPDEADSPEPPFPPRFSPN